MYNKNDIKYFRKQLLHWFKSNQREFPWRKKEISNYEIIISEILLQRTKANTVAKYYHVFFGQYPDWKSLINATIEDLERTLKPLGLYKHRAKRLNKIIDEFKKKDGLMPKNKGELQDSNLATLYLSNAYELFILNKRAPLLDVNMARVLSRYFNPKEIKDVRNDKELQALSRIVINVKNCKELNWAILDFASLICKSKKPSCCTCILSSRCKFNKLYKNSARGIGQADEPRLNIYYDDKRIEDNPDKPLKLLSLFSGCGGMDLGFEGDFIVHKNSINKKHDPDFISKTVNKNYVKVKATKFQTVFANDNLKDARNAWVNFFQKRGHSPEIYHVDSIIDLVKLHQQGVSVFPEKVDIVTGGFPCQDFSIAGKRNGLKSHKDHNGKVIKKGIPSIETRGQLYMWMKQVIDIVEPKLFVAENVKGLVNLSNVKDIIQQDFASANGNGYIVLPPQILHAADYGVPQSRERVFFIGLKKSELRKGVLNELKKAVINTEFLPYPKPSHSDSNNQDGSLKWVKLKDIFKDIVEPEFSSDPSQMFYSKAKFMGKHCQGQTEINPEGISPTIRAEHHGNIEFRRLSIQNGGKIENELNIGLTQRRLTPRECALIQTFPNDYDFVIPQSDRKFFVSPSSAYKLIGNAVPPLLSYHLARRLEKLWFTYFKGEDVWWLDQEEERGKSLTIKF